jgi:hypothetical protein
MRHCGSSVGAARAAFAEMLRQYLRQRRVGEWLAHPRHRAEFRREEVAVVVAGQEEGMARTPSAAATVSG